MYVQLLFSIMGNQAYLETQGALRSIGEPCFLTCFLPEKKKNTTQFSPFKPSHAQLLDSCFLYFHFSYWTELFHCFLLLPLFICVLPPANGRIKLQTVRSFGQRVYLSNICPVGPKESMDLKPYNGEHLSSWLGYGIFFPPGLKEPAGRSQPEQNQI